MTRSCTIAFVVFVIAATGAAAAADLLSNPGFDGSTSGWTDVVGPFVILAYTSHDAADSPTSGSASVTNIHSDSGVAVPGFQQCVPVVPGGEYRVGATVFITPGQGVSGDGGVTVYWTSNPDCSGYISGLSVESDATGSWVAVDDIRTAPAGAASAQVRLIVYKIDAGGSLEAHIDDVVFERVVFGDDFESGNLSEWSSATP